MKKSRIIPRAIYLSWILGGAIKGFVDAQKIEPSSPLEDALLYGPTILGTGYGMGVGIAQGSKIDAPNTTALTLGATQLVGGATITAISYAIGYGLGNLLK
jgi:hypothetical protein